MPDETNDATSERRRAMVELIAARGVRDQAVLDAMGKVPRERFIPERLREVAYEDGALPIDAGQTISQPYVVALMIEAAGVKSGQRVLEVGAGSGYSAAVMAAMGARVFAIERHEALAQTAGERLAGLGAIDVTMRAGDGTLGWPEEAPFDAIIVTAGGPSVPDGLRAQLAIGGILVIPIGSVHHHQTLVRMERTGEDAFQEENLGGVAFVPLIGAGGWPE